MKKIYFAIACFVIFTMAACEKDNYKKLRVIHAEATADPGMDGQVAFKDRNSSFEAWAETNGFQIKKGDLLNIQEEKNQVDKKRKIYRVKGIE